MVVTQSLHLGKRINEDLVAFTVKNVFTIEECKQFLDLVEGSWSSTHTNKYGEKWKDDAFRDNDSAHVCSKKLAAFIYSRVKEHVPDSTHVNKHLRFNRFREKQRVAPHVDGVYKSGTFVSKLTFMIYLNTLQEDQGGQTRFLSAETMKCVDVHPEAGMVLFFDQRCTHAALPVKNKGDEKYTLRSDVMFPFIC
jgi:hypothetical protein